MHTYVVVAPIRSTQGSGHIARNLLRGLRLAGAEVGAIDTCRPNEASVATQLDDLAPLLDAPVKLRGATVVHHAPLRDLSRSLVQHPTQAAERRIAYIDWPLPRFEESDLEILLSFDEVWVTTHYQRELLTACGLPRKRVHVVPPGVDAPVPSQARRETAEVYVSNAGERAHEPCDLDAVGRSVLERESSPLRPTPELLASILSQLGLKSPSNWLAGSRSRVVLCPIASEHDDWRAPLQRFLSLHGPNDDVTLCLWIDTELAPLLESLATEIEAEIGRAQGAAGPGDVLLLSAPLEHVPWDRVALDAAA
jgi:hypothetical protein